MNLKRNAIGVVLGGLLAANAFADTLSASQVGNISVGDLVGAGLTVNWYTAEKNIGLLQFDLTPYANKAVASATLNLYHWANTGDGATFNLYQNTFAWDSLIDKWAAAPAHLASPAAQLVIADPDYKTWRSVDVTVAVNAWTIGSLSNYGFTLERVDQDNPLVYFSATTANGGYAPTLTVAVVPEPETYAMMLAGLGLLGLAARRRKQEAAA